MPMLCSHQWTPWTHIRILPLPLGQCSGHPTRPSLSLSLMAHAHKSITMEGSMVALLVATAAVVLLLLPLMLPPLPPPPSLLLIVPVVLLLSLLSLAFFPSHDAYGSSSHHFTQ